MLTPKIMLSEANTCADAHPGHRTSGIFCHKARGKAGAGFENDITLDVTISLDRRSRYLLRGQAIKSRPQVCSMR